MDSEWFKARQKALGVTSFDIGAALGRDRTIVSKILNERQRMSLDIAKVFADQLETPLDEILRHAGALEASEAQALRPGFSESDATEWIPAPDMQDVHAIIANAHGADRPGADVWRVKSGAMSLQGYMIDDFMLVDANQSEQCKAGDVVIAQIYDWQTGEATTVLRRFEPPVLVAASASPPDSRVHVVDGNNVVIKGKVVASWRN